MFILLKLFKIKEEKNTRRIRRDKKRRIRRDENRIKRKKLGCMDAPVHNFRIVIIYFWDRIRSSEAAMGGGARSAPFRMAMSPKRRVRAAHGRARAAKTH
jgi:hypothetical protein